MAISSVMQGLIEVDGGKVFELDSPRGATWLESIGSFRYEPSGDNKAYTVRKEPSGYWYGCRKIAGTVRKKYIGKTSEISTAKLDEIAVALEDSPPPVSRVKKVAQVAQEVAQSVQVAEGVTQVVAEVAEVAQDRLTALELQVANLQKAVEALQEALPGKLKAGDSSELPKVDNEVAEQLQNELGNLKAEDELLRQELKSTKLQLENSPPTSGHLYQEIEQLKERNRLLHIKSREERQKLQEELATLKYRDESQSRRLGEKQARLDELETQYEEVEADRAKLLESSTVVTNKLREEVQELRSQLETEKTRGEELWEELGDTEEALKKVRAENSDLKQKLVAARKLPEAADLLNQLKTRRKKSSASLADVEKILEILGGDDEN